MNMETMRRRPIYLAMLALLLVAAGCGTTRPTGPGAARDSAQSVSADALLAGAVRRQGVDQALPLIQAEVEKSPDRVEMVWLYSQLCAQVSGCESEPIEARLRKLDPGNAAAWIGALARARAQRDTAAEGSILEAMGRGDRFDLYWNALVSRLAVAITRSGAARIEPGSLDAVTAGLNEAVGWLSGVAMPAFKPITDACSGASAANPGAAARCLRISETMLRGDTYIVEAVGLGIRERLATPGTAAAIAVAEQIEISRYQREMASRIMESQVEREKFSGELLELMTKLRREQDVFTAVIRWAGQPLLPQG
jgi:hypothetical protein